MVKGISRQVIVVHSPDPKLFEQAIFILKENAVGEEGITEDTLLREADRLVRGQGKEKRKLWLCGPVWAGAGAALTGLAWLICGIL